MQAIQFSQFGEPADVLSLVEGDLPEPGPGEVRLRLTHRTINPSDVMYIRGMYGRRPELPAVPGFEAMGVIEAVGEGVAASQVGQRVVPLGPPGTWQSHIILDAQQCLPVPDTVSDQTAAQFVVNPVTAWVMLHDELKLEAGDWVLQTAAGSTLGRVVLQIAKIQGYKTINLVRRRAQVQELLDLGADAVFCTEDDDVVAQVQAVTGGKGVKGAIEAVGGPTGKLAIASLRPGGTMLVYGLLSLEETPVNWGELLFRGLTIRGFWLTHWFRVQPPAHIQQSLTELMGLMAQGHLIPPVEAEYDFTQFKEAVLHAERPGRSGKVLLVG